MCMSQHRGCCKWVCWPLTVYTPSLSLVTSAKYLPKPEVKHRSMRVAYPASRHLRVLPVAMGYQDLCCPLRRTVQNSIRLLDSCVQVTFLFLMFCFLTPIGLLLLWFTPSWRPALLNVLSISGYSFASSMGTENSREGFGGTSFFAVEIVSSSDTAVSKFPFICPAVTRGICISLHLDVYLIACPALSRRLDCCL